MRKIRILHVLNWLAQGGVEVYLMNMIRTYDRSRYQMDFCCKGKAEGEMAEEARSLGSEILMCRMNSDQVRFIHRFAKLLKSNKYDIVNSHLCEYSGPVVYAAHLAKVPVRISSYHSLALRPGTSNILTKRPLLKPFVLCYMSVCYKLALRYSTAITGCSQTSIESHFPNRDPRDKRFKVMNYGIDVVLKKG